MKHLFFSVHAQHAKVKENRLLNIILCCSCTTDLVWCLSFSFKIPISRSHNVMFRSLVANHALTGGKDL